MDRFIDYLQKKLKFYYPHLKSNMDRFIDYLQKKLKFYYPHLKSNMDRFIGGGKGNGT